MSGFRNQNSINTITNNNNKPHVYSNDQDEWDTTSHSPSFSNNPKTIDFDTTSTGFHSSKKPFQKISNETNNTQSYRQSNNSNDLNDHDPFKNQPRLSEPNELNLNNMQSTFNRLSVDSHSPENQPKILPFNHFQIPGNVTEVFKDNLPSYQNQFKMEQSNKSQTINSTQNSMKKEVNSPTNNSSYQNQFQIEKAENMMNQKPSFQGQSQVFSSNENQSRRQSYGHSRVDNQKESNHQNQFRVENQPSTYMPQQSTLKYQNQSSNQSHRQSLQSFQSQSQNQLIMNQTKPNTSIHTKETTYKTEIPSSVYQNQFKKDISSSQGDLGRKFASGEVSHDSQTSLSGVDCKELAKRFNCFNASQVSAFYQEFLVAGDEGCETVHVNDLSSVSTKTGHSFNQVMDALQALSLPSSSGQVTFIDFLTAVASLSKSKVDKTTSTRITLGGTHENTTHTINLDEKESFVSFINSELEDDKDVSQRLPIDPTTMDIFTQIKDGILLAKLINKCIPNTIDERVLNLQKKLSPFQMIENMNVVINSSKAVGCSVVNIGAQDLMQGKEHLVLGLMWQIIRAGLSAKIDIRFHPELFRLLEPGESLDAFLKLPAEQILLRWFNYHLKRAGWHRKVSNFGGDIKDSQNYLVLLHEINPNLSTQGLSQTDLLERAEHVLLNAEQLGCRKYVTAKTICQGNTKLNFAFVANLFNEWPALEKLSQVEKGVIDDWLFGSEGDREARGVDPFVTNLYDSISDGTVLLQAIQHIRPDLIQTNRINTNTTSRFKQVENTNYLISIGKEMGFTLVGIQGSDITDGVKILALGFVWQLMREHVIQTLKGLANKGRDVTETDIIQWANSRVKNANKSTSIKSFRDASLKNGVFFLDVLDALRPGVVDYSAIQRGESDASCQNNAKYAISIARKLGATIFLLPEDIIEVKPKMILTFVGSLMALDN